MQLTQEQNTLLTRLEVHCHANNTNVWVGTLQDLKEMGGNRTLLNGLEQRGYIAPYMQSGNYWTIMPTRTQGMERDALQSQYIEEE